MDDLSIPSPAARRPREWRRAWRSLRALLTNPDDTMRAFEIFDAIDRNAEEHAFQRFAADPVGRRLLGARPSLAATVSDRTALAVLPSESFGRAYLAYLDANRFDALGLLDLKRGLEAKLVAEGQERPRLDSAREWFRDRMILMHDLWHVLTGYDTDDLGEAVLLPFSLAQTGGYATGLLVAGVAVRGSMLAGPSFPRYLYEGWRRGRRSSWLPALPYEELLPAPLATVQAIAAIPPPEVAHPGGIPRGIWKRPESRVRNLAAAQTT